MAGHAIDVLYAWARLGLAPGSSDETMRRATAHARRYRFAARERIEEINRFTQFFIERSRFGVPADSFEKIRKAYYRRAMELHPDRNPDDSAAEERLKDINAAYELVEEIHKEARDYFEREESERAALEQQARDLAVREAEAAGAEPPGAEPQTVNRPYEEAEAYRPEPSRPTRHTGAVKYMAASIPRFIRASRLFYLGRGSIIGSRMVRSPGAHHGYVYDIIMLPEIEFNRARLRLTMEGYGVQELTMSKLTPPYIPVDTKELIVPEGEPDPAGFARRYFMAEYGLDAA